MQTKRGKYVLPLTRIFYLNSQGGWVNHSSALHCWQLLNKMIRYMSPSGWLKRRNLVNVVGRDAGTVGRGVSDPKISPCSNHSSLSVVETSQFPTREGIDTYCHGLATGDSRQLIARAACNRGRSHCQRRQSERTNNQFMCNMPRLKKSRDNYKIGDGAPREDWAFANPTNKDFSGEKQRHPPSSNPGTNHSPSFQKLKWEASAWEREVGRAVPSETYSSLNAF